MTKEILTKEQLDKQMSEHKKALLEKSTASTKTLSDYINPNTGGELNLPKLTLNGIAIIEELYGSFHEAIESKRLSTIGGILWAIANQNNEDVWLWNAEQRQASIRKVLGEIDLENLETYTKALERVFGVTEGNGEAPEQPGQSG